MFTNQLFLSKGVSRMAIIVMLNEPGTDKFYINLPNGDVQKECYKVIDKKLDDAKELEDLDGEALVDAVFDAIEEYGIVFEW